MREVLVLTALVGSSACALFRANVEPPAGALGEEVVRTAPSGLRIVTQSSRAAPVVALELSIATGSADDPTDAPGTALTLQHLAVHAGGLEELARAHGGQLESWITRDETRVSILLPSRALTAALRALARATRAPALRPGSIDRHVGTLVEELRNSRADPGRVALERAVAVALSGHPYGRSPWPTPDALAHLGTEPLRRTFRGRWHPANMTLSIVGDIDADEVVEQAGAFFGADRNGAGPSADPRRPTRRAPRPPAPEPPPEVVADRIESARIAIAFALPELGVGELAVLERAAAVLEAGRLEDAVARAGVRMQGPATVAVQANEAGTLFLIGAAVGPRDAAQGLEEALLELHRMARLGPTGAELEQARAILATADADARDGVRGLARLLLARATHPRAVAARTAARGPLATTAFREAFARLIVPEQGAVVALVPEGEVERARRSLEGLADRLRVRADHELASGARRSAGGIVHETLASGVRLVTAPDRRSPVVAVRMALLGGSRLETEARAGACALVASAMARAAREGGPPLDVVPFAGRDTFGIESRFAAARLDEALGRLVSGLVRPVLDPAALEPDRRAALAALHAADRSPRTIVPAALARLVFGPHPYGLDPAGSLAALADLDTTSLGALHHEALVGNRLVIAAAGDVDADALSIRTRGLVGSLPPGARLPELAAVPQEPRRDHRVSAGVRSEVALGLTGASWSEPERATLDVIAAVLDGPDGRIAAALRARGLGTAPWARHVSGLSSGSFEAGATVPAPNVEEAIAAIRAEVARLSIEPLPSATLVRAREAAIGRWETGLDALGTRVAALAMAELAGVDLREHSDHLARVDAARIRAVAARRLRADRAHVVVIGPAAEPEPTPP